jgi:hypothetical protein
MTELATHSLRELWRVDVVGGLNVVNLAWHDGAARDQIRLRQTRQPDRSATCHLETQIAMRISDTTAPGPHRITGFGSAIRDPVIARAIRDNIKSSKVQ